MSNNLRIQPGPTVVTNNSSAQAHDWDRLSEAKRQIATERLQLVKAVLTLEPQGLSLAAAIDALMSRIQANTAPRLLIEIAGRLGRGKKMPNRATLYRWIKAYRDGGLPALAPAHKGSERAARGWEAVAMRLYARPSKPSAACVARELREEHGFPDASDSAVRRYLNSLPATLSDYSTARLGQRHYRDKHGQYTRRDSSTLPPGLIYQGDGHTVDVYLAHPATGKLWRPELTVWMDVRSRYIVGWYLSEAESALSTIYALSHALLSQDHVPAMLHIDNGSGYRSKMMNDESLGFYARFSIEPMFSLPYNARAKGQVERWFRTLEEDFGKRWPSYCGKDMAGEVLQKLLRDLQQGKRQLPTLQEYSAGLQTWIGHYHNRPHSALDGRSPNEIWSSLDRAPLHMPQAAVCRPWVERRVRRQTVQLHNREYSTPELSAHEGKAVTVEYDLHDDAQVRVFTLRDRRWLCDAHLVQKRGYIPHSRVEELQQQRLNGQLRRIEQKRQELQDRASQTIDHTTALEQLGWPAAEAFLPGEKMEAETLDFDLLRGFRETEPEEGVTVIPTLALFQNKA